MRSAGCGDDGIRVFRLRVDDDMDAAKTESLCYLEKAHASDVNCVHWNPTSPSLLLSAGDDGCIKIWRFVDDNCSDTQFSD